MYLKEFLMFPNFKISRLGLFSLLALIFITRASHFGNASLLPDASIACFFLLGALNARIRWMLLAVLIAVAIDLIVTRFMIVSDYCMSPGYWGLIPIYGMVWWLGRRIHNLHRLAFENLLGAWLDCDHFGIYFVKRSVVCIF